MAAPASRPPTASIGTGHHTGAVANPNAVGSVSNIQCRPWLIAHRNKYAAAEMGTPRKAAKTSNPRYWRECTTASESSGVEAFTDMNHHLAVVLHVRRGAPQIAAERPTHLPGPLGER